MNKKLTSVLIAFTLIVPTTANAALKSEAVIQKPTIAILDTSLDSTIPVLQGRIAYEVCILGWMSCPNGRNFQEGPGAASMPADFFTKNGFEHGTQMASIFAQNTTAANIVFVRIIGNTSRGTRQLTTESAIVNAFDWVINNKDRFNIQAVSMSQGHHNLASGTNYCPNTPNTEKQIKSLVAAGIPVFLPTGNTRDYKRIDWPACIDSSISIGASNDYNEVPIWSNVDTLKTDFYALGTTTAVMPGNKTTNVAGTSASAQVAAAKWISLKAAKPTLTYQQIYDLFKLKSKTIKGVNGIIGSMIDLQGALNG